jgi:two-component system cell cycle response regulator
MPNPATIIIIDDDETSRYILSDLVEMLEYIPMLAADGVTALNIMRKQPPDLALLDILMPKMTGYEVLKHMKEDPVLSKIPVIITSGVRETDIVVQCVKKGAEDYIVKPYNLAVLKNKITACLGKKMLDDQDKERQHQKEEYELHLKIYEKQMEEYTRSSDTSVFEKTAKFSSITR